MIWRQHLIRRLFQLELITSQLDINPFLSSQELFQRRCALSLRYLLIIISYILNTYNIINIFTIIIFSTRWLRWSLSTLLQCTSQLHKRKELEDLEYYVRILFWKKCCKGVGQKNEDLTHPKDEWYRRIDKSIKRSINRNISQYLKPSLAGFIFWQIIAISSMVVVLFQAAAIQLKVPFY